MNNQERETDNTNLPVKKKTLSTLIQTSIVTPNMM